MSDWTIEEFESAASATDQFQEGEITPLKLGLFGEVGQLLSVAKKHRRDAHTPKKRELEIKEELGDIMWYFSVIVRRCGLSTAEVFDNVAADTLCSTSVFANSDPNAPLGWIAYREHSDAEAALFQIARECSKLFESGPGELPTGAALERFATVYLDVLGAFKLGLNDVIEENVQKIASRFGPERYGELPKFDDNFPSDERIPKTFQINIEKTSSGKTFLRYNGVFIGDALADNIADDDGFRYHDVFHMANAAILGWSPVFRALLKRKRKSCPDVEEAQDSGRAIVVEEGLTAWLFSYAKDFAFFESHSRLPYEVLKMVQMFVRGYEVERCPLWLWERSILGGFSLFREVVKEGAGVVSGDRDRREVWFEGRENEE